MIDTNPAPEATDENLLTLPLAEVLRTLRFCAETAHAFDIRAMDEFHGFASKAKPEQIQLHGPMQLAAHFVRVIGALADDGLPDALKLYPDPRTWLYGWGLDDELGQGGDFEGAAASADPDRCFVALVQIFNEADILLSELERIQVASLPFVGFAKLGLVRALAASIGQIGALAERATREREHCRNSPEAWLLPASLQMPEAEPAHA